MALYLLPCTSCDEKQQVDSRQAGESIVCRRCGTSLQVPTLRGLRNLEPVDVSDERLPPAKAKWSTLQGVLFSVGILLALVAGAMAARHFVIYSLLSEHTQDRTAEVDAYTDEVIDAMPLGETMELWHVFKMGTLGEEGLPPWEEARRVSDAEIRAGSIWLAISLAGVVAVVTSLLLTRRQPPR